MKITKEVHSQLRIDITAVEQRWWQDFPQYCTHRKQIYVPDKEIAFLWM